MAIRERLLPQNIEAEYGVLGSIFIDQEVLAPVAEFLIAEDFYRDTHRIIFQTMLHLYNQRTPIDIITVTDALEQQGKLHEIGGPGVISSFMNYVPTSGNAVYYGRIVARTGMLRRLIHACSQVVAHAYEDSEENAGMTLEMAEEMIFEISQQFNSATATSTVVGDLTAAYIERLSQIIHKPGEIAGVPTGLTDLDHLLGGFQKSDLIILAGRPGMGKTGLALTIAYNAAQQRRNIGVFSLEMNKDQLVGRLISMTARIDQQRLRAGWIGDDEWSSLIESAKILDGLPMWIDDTAMLSTIQLRSKARQWMSVQGLDLLIVDYLQMLHIPATDVKRQRNREQEVAEISRSLKGLARELNIPVLALASLSRAVESRASKVPQLSDLRESGSIESDADVVLFLYRDDVYRADSERANQADIIVAKHRNGPVGEVSLAFEKKYTYFHDLLAPGGRPGSEHVWADMDEEEIMLDDEA